MGFTKEDIQVAYQKLKSYIYYDNTDLILRRQLVEFETNIGKDFLFKNPSSHYNIGGDIFSFKIRFSLEEKFERIAHELNTFHENSDFFNSILKNIDIDFYPKKIKSPKEESNFISNERIKDKYEVERVTPFINAPIELHIISVLWIIQHGVSMDKELKDKCLVNRLILNKDKSSATGAGTSWTGNADIRELPGNNHQEMRWSPESQYELGQAFDGLRASGAMRIYNR